MKSYHIEQINSDINKYTYVNGKMIRIFLLVHMYIIQYSAFILVYYLIEIFLLGNNIVLISEIISINIPVLIVSKQKCFLDFLMQMLCIQTFI